MLSTLQILATASAEAASTGNPVTDLAQQFGFDLPMFFAQVVSFSAVTYLLYRLAFKPVLETLDERKTKIESGLVYAEKMEKKLLEAEKHHEEAVRKASEEARRIVDEARAIAGEKIEKSSQDAIKAAEDITRRAEAQIELDRKQMIAEARSAISRLVVTTASKVLARELSNEDKSRFAESASASLVESSN